MDNNSILPGFDDVQDGHISIKLEKVQEMPEFLIIHLSGHIDHGNHKFVHDRITRIIDAGFIWLIIDCKNCEAFSDTAVGPFTYFLKAVHEKKGALSLVAVQPSLYQLLELTALTKYFNCRNNLSEAIEFLKYRKSKG